jgi:hypothetical protein
LETKIKIENSKISDIIGYNTYKFYLSGELRPIVSGSPDNLLQGTKSAERYTDGINHKAKLKFESRCGVMFRERKNRLKTFILTYRRREWITEKQRIEIVKESKKHINTFLTILRKTYQCNAYAYTIESTKNSEVHFHFIVDMPYVNAEKLNNTWAKVRGDYSNNAVRAIREIKNAGAAIRYAAKYLAKSEQINDELLKGFRRWATSNNLSGKEYLIISGHQVRNLVEKFERKEVVNKSTGEIFPALKTFKISVEKDKNLQFQYNFCQINSNVLQYFTNIAFQTALDENLKLWKSGYKKEKDKDIFAREYNTYLKISNVTKDIFGNFRIGHKNFSHHSLRDKEILLYLSRLRIGHS